MALQIYSKLTYTDFETSRDREEIVADKIISCVSSRNVSQENNSIIQQLLCDLDDPSFDAKKCRKRIDQKQKISAKKIETLFEMIKASVPLHDYDYQGFHEYRHRPQMHQLLQFFMLPSSESDEKDSEYQNFIFESLNFLARAEPAYVICYIHTYPIVNSHHLLQIFESCCQAAVYCFDSIDDRAPVGSSEQLLGQLPHFISSKYQHVLKEQDRYDLAKIMISYFPILYEEITFVASFTPVTCYPLCLIEICQIVFLESKKEFLSLCILNRILIPPSLLEIFSFEEKMEIVEKLLKLSFGSPTFFQYKNPLLEILCEIDDHEEKVYMIASEYAKTDPSYLLNYLGKLKINKGAQAKILEKILLNPSLYSSSASNNIAYELSHYLHGVAEISLFVKVTQDLLDICPSKIQAYLQMVQLLKLENRIDLLYSIALELIRKNPHLFVENINYFDPVLENPICSMAILEAIFNHDARLALENLRQFPIGSNIEKISHLIKSCLQNSSVDDLILLQTIGYMFGMQLPQIAITIANCMHNKQLAVPTIITSLSTLSNVEAICQSIDQLDFDLQKKKQIASKAMEFNPELLAKNIRKFGFKVEEDRFLLQQLLQEGIRKNLKAIQPYILHFGITEKQLDLMLGQQMLQDARSLNEKEIEHRIVSCRDLPEYLEGFGKNLYLLAQESNDKNVIKLSLYYSSRCTEKAALFYQNNGATDKAIALRIELAQRTLISPESNFSKVEELLKSPVCIKLPNGIANYGRTFFPMGGAELRKCSFRVRDICCDRQEQRILDFKLTYPARERVGANLQSLVAPQAIEQLKREKICQDVILTKHPYYYLLSQDGNFATEEKESKGICVGDVIHLKLKDLARIEMGADREYGSLYTQVYITFSANASPQKMQTVLALMGLAPAAVESTEAVQERLKTYQLIHFFFPAFASGQDKQEAFYERPIQEILAMLGSDVRIVEKFLKRIKPSRTMTGAIQFKIKGLAKKAEKLGCRGLMCGVAPTQSAQKAVDSVQGIYDSKALLSTQRRWEAGWFGPSSSATEDFKNNSSNRVFLRSFSPKFDGKLMSDIDLKGSVQLWLKTKVVEWMPSFHMEDQYGAHNPYITNLEFSEASRNRPGFIKFLEEMNHGFYRKNEVMILDALKSKEIVYVTYQDKRKEFSTQIDQYRNELLDPTGILENYYLCTSLEEQLQFITAHREAMSKIEFPYAIFRNGASQNKTCQAADLIDIKESLVQTLKKMGMLHPEEMIKENNMISLREFEICNTFLLEQEKRAKELACGSKALSLIREKKMSDSSAELIENLEQRMSEFSSEQLFQYIKADTQHRMKELKNLCQTHLSNGDFSGQDSLNRQLVTDRRFVTYLQDPHLIVAMLAITQLHKRGEISADEYEEYLIFQVDFGQGGIKERSILDCLYFALRCHPVILEKCPLNIPVDKKSDSLNIRLYYLNQFVKQADIDKTFGAVLKALYTTYDQIMEKPPQLGPLISSALNQPYQLKLWQKYMEQFNKLSKVIDQTDEKELLKNEAKYSPRSLKEQARRGFTILMEFENVDPTQLTLSELTAKIVSGTALIHPMVSHLLFDRLHFLAALKSRSEDEGIQIKEGVVTLRDLMHAIIKHFSDSGVNENNAIAAEQFYIRIQQIRDFLHT